MYLRARITTSCRTAGSRYTRLNLLGWGILCPHARDLLWHGSTPLYPPEYPTADESKELHDWLVKQVDEALRHVASEPSVALREYWHELGIIKDGEVLCARSRADLIYLINLNGTTSIVYVEVSSTRLNPAKPWQALLRGIALYYEWGLPVGIVIVSPEKIMYKLLEDEDQTSIMRMLKRESEGFRPSPNLCSLCELRNYCPFKEA